MQVDAHFQSLDVARGRAAGNRGGGNQIWRPVGHETADSLYTLLSLATEHGAEIEKGSANVVVFPGTTGYRVKLARGCQQCSSRRLQLGLAIQVAEHVSRCFSVASSGTARSL